MVSFHTFHVSDWLINSAFDAFEYSLTFSVRSFTPQTELHKVSDKSGVTFKAAEHGLCDVGDYKRHISMLFAYRTIGCGKLNYVGVTFWADVNQCRLIVRNTVMAFTA